MRLGLRRPHRVIQQGLAAEYRFDKKNRLLYSEAFDNAAWDTNNLTKTADQTTAPDGRTTADKIAEDAVNNIHRMNQQPASGADQTHSFSVYAKYGTRQWLYLYMADVSGSHVVRAWFDIQNGVVGTVSHVGNGSGEKGFIQDVGNGWYRCTLAGKPNTSAGSILVSYYLASGNGVSSGYLGDVDKYVYLWGAQLELGSAATTYRQVTDGQTLTDDKGGYNGQLGSTSGADTNDPTWDGQGLVFATDDYVVLGGDDSFKGLNAGGVEAVVKVSSLASNVAVFSTGPKTASSTGLFFIIFVTTNGAVAIQQRNADSDVNSIYAYTANGVMAVGGIYHIVWDVGAGGNVLYINGEPVALTYSAGSAASTHFFDDIATTQNYWFGTRKYSGSLGLYLNGSIYYGMLYGGRRTAAEISHNYHYLRQILAKRSITLAA